MNRKLEWILETWFDGSLNRMVEKAILDERISFEEFRSGFEKIRNAQWDGNTEDFIPEEFKKL